MEIESHPLEPFLPSNARILMLGSFPPQKKRWSMDFFYPNYINDMWRIFGHIFFGDKLHFVIEEKKTFRLDEIKDFLQDKGVALYDTACKVIRMQDNASDKFLEVVEETDLKALLEKIPECGAIVTTGGKASDIICSQFNITIPKIGEYSLIELVDRKIRLYRMPSSSRAYPMKIENKAAYYEKMFKEMFLL